MSKEKSYEELEFDLYYANKEIERLNNIINELEEVLKDNAERCNINAKIFKKDFWLSLEGIYKNLLDKLQELKEKD